MEKLVEIKGCVECPFFKNTMDGMACNHPHFDGKPAYSNIIITQKDIYVNNEPPAECPLRVDDSEELFDMGDDYCKHCNSCGIEGCCSPTMCDMKPSGLHCESNLEQLKFGYWMSEELGKRNPELYHEIYDAIKKELEDEEE